MNVLSKIKKMYFALKKVDVAVLCAIFFAISGCENPKSISEEPTSIEELTSIEEPTSIEELTSLTGTIWKLVGIVDIETGALEELEPKDWKKAYTLSFVTDSTFIGITSTNECLGKYQFTECSIKFGAFTKINEFYDGVYYMYTIRSAHSFSLKKNELCIYTYNENIYLLYKQIQP